MHRHTPSYGFEEIIALQKGKVIFLNVGKLIIVKPAVVSFLSVL